MTTMTPETERKLDTIRKLLAKAEKAATTAEAEAYTAKATELMMRYTIDEAMIGERNHSQGVPDSVGKRSFTMVGYPLPKTTLLAGIGQTFGCKVIRMGTGYEQPVEVWGFESDLLAVETLYASLIIQAQRDMDRAYAHKPAWEHGRSFKTSFLTGFANTVFNRLADQRRGVVREAEDSNPGTALALRNRTVAVRNAYEQAYPNTSTTSGPSVTSRAGLNSGREAGARADLGQTSVGVAGRRALGR